MEQGLFTIELTLDEFTIVEAIRFDPLAVQGDAQTFAANAELACRLTKSLLERKGIPPQRISYFVDPEYNRGGRGSSRKQDFERNGVAGEAIFRHGHFLKYLRYFIYGADLPVQALLAFRQAHDDCGSVTSGDIAPLSKAARKLVHVHHLEPKVAAEEFYKLCLDLGMEPDEADSIRSAVRKIKLKH